MSIKNWNAGIIRPVAVAPAGPLATGAAPGVWTLDQQAFWQKQGLWPIAGNNLYIEDVFSTYLYTGTGASQTITNGIDLSGKGGLVWVKERNNTGGHILVDTVRGASNYLETSSTAAQGNSSQFIPTFYNNGFSTGNWFGSTNTYASWTFRKQAKFFDVVTYTGNGANRTIAHNLGSVPGCIMIKRTDTTGAWAVYHRSLANTNYMVLNTTSGEVTDSSYWNSTTPTSSVFSLGTATPVNANGGTYVAYLFAHDAGGFGAAGTDNVISCGSFTTSASGLATVTLGYEPQWLLIKRTTASTFQNWRIIDTMRGCPVGSYGQELYPNVSDAEFPGSLIDLTATGFNVGPFLTNSATYIYIAIRRGPMKTPTSGTSVFSPVARTGTGATANVTTSGFAGDLVISKDRGSSGFGWGWSDKLRGAPKILSSDSTNNEASYASYTDGVTGFLNTGYTLGADGSFLFNASGYNYGQYYLRRAPGFFDVVCYTGTGASRTVNHNLGVVPELIIIKNRSSGVFGWIVGTNFTVSNCQEGSLNTTGGFSTFSYANQFTAQPTATQFTLGIGNATNQNSSNFVAYLFATVAGVSKVGSYTGTGTTQQINCGFTGGARFVLIKRTNSTGDWYVWDSARGIVAGNDPYLLLNSTAAEVTSTDYIDTYSAGFEISSTAPAAINANGGSFIFLAIA